MNEGVIKFRCHWVREPIQVEPTILDSLRHWRTRLRARGLLGVDADGIGFGNLSVRLAGREFLITGSGTGGTAELAETQLSLVTAYRVEENLLTYSGLVEASSESLSHAAIYRARAEAGAVIHVHSTELWEAYLGRLPSTPPDIEYGTPEMALALESLVREGTGGSGVGKSISGREGVEKRGSEEAVVGGRAGEGVVESPPRALSQVVVMGGHRDGLIAYGRDLDEAGGLLVGLAAPQET